MDKHWTQALFNDPPSYYRGAPFWAWNSALDIHRLKSQVNIFRQMGMGGFHIHCRVGLDTEYLGKTFMDCVKSCKEEGEKLGLYTYLYDEDRWPSGSAGGLVTKESKYRSRYLRFQPYKESDPRRTLLGAYRIVIENGYLALYEFFSLNEIPSEEMNLWFVYLEIAEENPWHNNQTYVDTLNKAAIEKFIEVTHEAYYKVFGDSFGKSVPSIFTDEPQFRHKEMLNQPYEKRSVVLPYTDGFESFYISRYSESFLDKLPEVIWQLPNNEPSITRYRYHDSIAELFASSFADVIGEWCENHNIKLTGHMMEEPTLLSQTNALGDAMRSYRSFHEPGIDMLCDWREYNTAKQAQSVARQYGRAGVMSEIYGVTNWDFDFRGHKLAGDWQAALGVTRRVHHLAWSSMKGEAKRDYPASIFYQSPWYKEYKYIEDHFARINTAMMRGQSCVNVAVLHPIESYWLAYGPKQQTGQYRAMLDERFDCLTQWLLFGLIDFDFLSEALLPSQQVIIKEGRLYIGEMSYSTVVLPRCDTIRETTLHILNVFVEQGGKLIYIEALPNLVDAVIKDDAQLLLKKGNRISFNQFELLKALNAERDIAIETDDGLPSTELIYQMRQEGDVKWLFVANAQKPLNHDIPRPTQYQFKLRGNYNVHVCDTLSGSVYEITTEYDGMWTNVRKSMDIHDSILLKLESIEDNCNYTVEDNDLMFNAIEQIRLLQPSSFELSESNVLLLDQCKYRIDGDEWLNEEEVLRIDNKLRSIYGYPQRMEAMPQPWVEHNHNDTVHCVELKFIIESEIQIENVQLAIEQEEGMKLLWNNKPIELHWDGWFVDEDIKTLNLKHLQRGRNELLIIYPFTRKTNLEWMYLLGDFGVRLCGNHAIITEPVKELFYGDYTCQGLPFYAGQVIYRILVELEAGYYKIRTAHYRAPLLKVSVDGNEEQPVAFAPYEVDLGYLKSGLHNIKIISFGNRVNAFGSVHNCDRNFEWFGPNSWRTNGESYAYEYQLKEMGILSAPTLIRREINIKE